ncbi:MAG: hypothetical protein JKY56_02740 [Kofleriaceae bacterium]|nr:hypothetical protein [Kofleriaceae bacterium]
MADEDLEKIEKKIKKQAKAAFFGGVVGLFFFGIVFGPGAMIRGNIAKKLIIEHGVGQEHASRAQTGIYLGLAGLLLWTLLLFVRLTGRV